MQRARPPNRAPADPGGPALDHRIAFELASKAMGRRLGVSPRTVDVYRARLMRKTGAATTPEMINKLLAGQR